MKKTIIASAIAAAVAAPAAFADVKISGQLNYEFVDASGNDMGEDLNTDVVISGSEDLGNGMKASFKMSGSPDGSSDGFGDDQIISLSGDFGTVSVGRMETFSESKVRAAAANDASDVLSNEVAGTIGERSNGVIAYSSPSMGGFQVHAAATILDATSTQSDDFDNTDIGISYSNAGLTVMVSQADGYGNDGASSPTTDSTKTTETSIAVKYVMGDFTVAAVNAEDDNGTSADTDETWVGVSYKMGNNTFAISTKSSDNANGDDDTISVKHALSKQTSIGLTHLNDQGGNDQTALTIAHTF
jgi:predicted porin